MQFTCSKLLLPLGVTIILVFVVAATIDTGAEANSFFERVKRPFKATARKARSLKDRALNRHRQLSENVSGRQTFDSLMQPRFAADPDEHTARSNRGNVNSTTESDDFNAMCVFSRGPSMKKPPALFYFSPQIKNKGCEVQVELELASVNDEMRELEQEFSRESIQNKLLNAHIYDPARPTYFLIHGFMAGWNSDNWLCATKDLILENTDANVFIVDWSGGSKPMLPIDYGASVSNTKYVASLIGEFVTMLMQMTGQQDAKRFHLIGHSLGAHISGFIGYKVGSVGQITGLDPAGPCFSSGEQDSSATDDGLLQDGSRRLSPKSADYVLALHTDTPLFGLNENCGDYDVYVNGGLKQPGCSEASVPGRLNELMSGNIKDAVDLNIACAHSYAHTLCHHFLPFSSLREITSRLFGLKRSRRALGVSPSSPDKLDKCYPMAYECASWDAYKAGECGFCRDNDRHCVYTGLSLGNFQAAKLTDESEFTSVDLKDDGGSGEDDNELNGETDDDGDKNEDDDKQPHFDKTKRNSRGQHFIKTTEADLTCLFTYQIIVAAKRTQIDQIGADADKFYYYLQLPLEHSGVLSGDQATHVRLAQVSHKIDPESPAYSNLRTTYVDALKERNGDVNFDESRDDLDFYTALITFKRRPDDQCAPDDQTNGQADSKDKWQLCETLDKMQEARLWSANREKLDAIAWVSMNFMSGVSYEQRMTKSYVMQRGEAIIERDTLDEKQRAKLDRLDPKKSKSFGNTLDEAREKADCLVHALNKKTSRVKVKCRKDSEELAYALDLKPKKL